MKIKSNKTFNCYETAYESWSNGKAITLDGIRLVPATILDEIVAEIMELENFKLGSYDLDQYNDHFDARIIFRDEVLQIIHNKCKAISKEQ